MSIRVYALSTELNVPSKKLLELCKLEGISVKSHASTLTEGEAGRLRAAAQRQASAAESVEAESEAPAEPPPTVPPPLPARVEPPKLAFAPKLGARRRRPAPCR